MELFLRDAEEILRKKVGKVRTLFKVFALWLIAGLFTMMLLALDFLDTIDIDTNAEENYEEDDDSLDAICFSIIGYVAFVAFVSILLCKFHRRRQNKARKAIQRLIDQKYSMFGAQGLRWSMPLHFPHWIELWKDYKGQANYIPQGPQMYAPYALTMPTQVVPQQTYPQIQSQPQSQSQPQPQPQFHHQHQHHHHQPQSQAQAQLQFARSNSQNDQRSGLSQPLLSQQSQDVNLYPQLGGQN